MTKKKTIKKETTGFIVNEPVALYANSRIRIFKSFEDQATYEIEQMAALSPEQILKQMRTFINIAFGMHGYNPNNLPKKHSIKIISK